jgi:HEAT repeat protein
MLDPVLRVQKLIRRLHASKQLVRLHAGCLLGQMGPAAQEAVPALLELLQSDSVADRKLAVWTLGRIGQGAVGALPALQEAARDGDESTRILATAALEKIDAVRLRRAA